MQYLIIEEDKRSRLEKRINEYIKQGWRPVGGVSVCCAFSAGGGRQYNSVYTQAIIKE